MTTITQRIDEWGRLVLNDAGILEMFYKGHFQTPDALAEASEAVTAYNKWCTLYDRPEKALPISEPLNVTPEQFHRERQSQWKMDDEYKTIDVAEWLYERCTTEVEVDRVTEEMELFRKHGMENVLRFLIFMTTTLRAEGVWWGVGRGSSVASYCLYLIGVHKIDSLRFGLDIREFIRD